MNSDKILEVNHLVVHYVTDEEVVEAVNDVSFSLNKGEVIGLVGETGAGKTTIALSTIGLLPHPPAKVIDGEILFGGENLLEKTNKEMQKIRGNKISMIFQDPMTALNPVMTVGAQIEEVIQLHNPKMSKGETQRKAAQMLETVGIRKERYKDYPHQFSGGMKQRVVIAIALACEPELLIADEPTTALDVTIQAQVLELMKELQKERQTSMIMITHDFGIVAEICNKCAVVYAGEIVEYGTVEHIFENPCHPYTIALFGAIPSLDKDVDKLNAIPGMVSDPTDLPSYCSFANRCQDCNEQCTQRDSKLVEVEPGHFVKCMKYEQKAGK